MIELDFKPHGVCARMIHVELDDAGKTIEAVSFTGGCNGNLKAISKLVAGQPVEHIVELLQGNTCGPRRTSCADQLTLALCEAAGRAEAAERVEAPVAVEPTGQTTAADTQTTAASAAVPASGDSAR